MWPQRYCNLYNIISYLNRYMDSVVSSKRRKKNYDRKKIRTGRKIIPSQKSCLKAKTCCCYAATVVVLQDVSFTLLITCAGIYTHTRRPQQGKKVMHTTELYKIRTNSSNLGLNIIRIKKYIFYITSHLWGFLLLAFLWINARRHRAFEKIWQSCYARIIPLMK